MSAVTFTQAQIRRAVDAAKSSGLEVSAIEVTPEGVIRILTPTATPKATDPVDNWFENESKT